MPGFSIKAYTESFRNQNKERCGLTWSYTPRRPSCHSHTPEGKQASTKTTTPTSTPNCAKNGPTSKKIPKHIYGILLCQRSPQFQKSTVRVDSERFQHWKADPCSAMVRSGARPGPFPASYGGFLVVLITRALLFWGPY